MQYRRNPAVSEARVDDEIFLVAPDGEEVFYLNAVSSGLWRALSEPRDAAALAALYRAAFPDVDAAAIEADVATALDELRTRLLVLTEDDRIRRHSR